MIPKKIHYCWFGGNPLPEDAKRYIESWKKYCSDYEIIEWNEQSFDVNSVPYVKEALEARKWAFITDYVRLWAIYNFGGIYMDTDVEVLKPLDDFLNHHAFSGFESSCAIPTGIMAGEQGNHWFKLQLDYYTDRHFKKEDGSFDLTTNVVTITDITKKNYPMIELNNTFQDIGDIVFYPSEFFCPKSHETGIITCTDSTFTIHHFAGSWLTDDEKEVSELCHKVHSKIRINFVARIILIFAGVFRRVKKYGVKNAIKHYMNRGRK